jgi:hypothetical protein
MSLIEENPQHFDEGDNLNKDFDEDHSKHPHEEHHNHDHKHEINAEGEHHLHGQVHKHAKTYDFNKIPPNWKEAEKHGVK